MGLEDTLNSLAVEFTKIQLEAYLQDKVKGPILRSALAMLGYAEFTVGPKDIPAEAIPEECLNCELHEGCKYLFVKQLKVQHGNMLERYIGSKDTAEVFADATSKLEAVCPSLRECADLMVAYANHIVEWGFCLGWTARGEYDTIMAGKQKKG